MDNFITGYDESTQITLLTIGHISIAFPQSDIVYVDNFSQVINKSETENSTGQLSYNSINIPVYTFDKQLKLLDHLNPENRICAIIKNVKQNSFFGLMCDTLEKFELQSNATISATPKIMKKQISPVIGFTKKDNALVLMCNEASFNQYVNSFETNSEQELKNA